MAERDIEIVISARDKAAAVLALQEQRLKKMGQAAAEASRQTAKIGGGVSSMTDYAVSLGAAVNTVRGALVLADVATAGWKDDSQGVVDAMKQLPLGLGGIMSITEDIYDRWTGFKEMMQEYNAAQEKSNAIQTRRIALIATVGRFVQQAADEEADARGKLMLQYERDAEALKQQAKDLGESEFNIGMAALNRRLSAQLAEQDKADRERLAKEEDLEEERMRRMMDAQRKASQAALEEYKQRIADQEKIETEYADWEQKMRGERSRAADKSRTELEDKLKAQLDKRQREGRTPGLAIGMSSTLRYEPGTVDPIRKATEKTAANSDKQTRTLEELLRAVKDLQAYEVADLN